MLDAAAGHDWARHVGKIEEFFTGPNKVDAVICTAGGWTGGGVADPGFPASVTTMLQACLYPCLVSGASAAKHLAPNGSLILVGSAAALGGTGGMVGYGLAKAGVHHLVRSLAAGEAAGLPAGTRVLGLLPTTIDTPSNRAGMPSADFSSWTPVDYLASLMVDWAAGGSSVPASGSLVTVSTAKGAHSLKVLDHLYAAEA